MLLESKRKKGKMFQHKATGRQRSSSLCLKNIYPSSVFAGWKQWILHGFSQKTKVPGLWRKLALWCPPESTPDPPQGNSSEVTLKRGDASLLHRGPATPYSCVDLGGRLTHQTQAKTQSTSFFLVLWDCLMFAGVHCHGKNNRHYCVLCCGAENQSPYSQSPLKKFQHIKDLCNILLCAILVKET